MSRGRISEIIGNTNFGKIDNLLSQGRDMSYIAGHYQVDLALAWAFRLQGKPDHEKFKEKDYRGKANDKTPSISSYPREDYEEFFERFFLLAHQKVKETTRIAFLNADWRDFQSTPALKENEGKAVTIFDYHRILSKTGWKVTHRIECPLSSERMSGNEVLKINNFTTDIHTIVAQWL